jgi:hyperosmotically inducible protein
MRIWIAIPLFACLVALIFIVPTFAHTNLYTNALPIVLRTDPIASEPEMTGTGDTTGSWQQSASEAVRNAEIATQKVYNDLARNVQNVSLEAKIRAVLHENKATRDSDVQVTANHGVVTLTGEVPSAQSAQQVQDVVASVYGVKAVNNNLKYPHDRGNVTPPDADSTGVAHPAYSDTAPAEKVPAH